MDKREYENWYNGIFFRCVGIFLILVGVGSCNKLSQESYSMEGFKEKLLHERIMAGCEEVK